MSVFESVILIVRFTICLLTTLNIGHCFPASNGITAQLVSMWWESSPSRLLFAVSPAPYLKRLDTQKCNAELHLTDSINIPFRNNINMYKYCEILICTNIVKWNGNKNIYYVLFLSSNWSRDFRVALEHSTQLMQSIAIEWLFAAPFGHFSRWRYAGASVLRCITVLPICTTTRETMPPSGL